MTTVSPSWPIINPQEIRFVDLDALGHVNNAHFSTYLEQARAAFFKACADIFPSRDQANDIAAVFPFILARVEIDYMRPITLNDRVETAMRVSNIGTKSFQFEYEIRANGEIAARAKTVQVAYDYVLKKAVPLSEPFKEKITRLSSHQI